MNPGSSLARNLAAIAIGALGLMGIASGTQPQLAAGDSFSIALTSTGKVLAWGSNIFSQLGDGTGAFNPTPSVVAMVPGLNRTVGGNQCSYALMNDGTIWAWGDNSNGQLGDGTTRSRVAPVRVTGIEARVVNVASGARHALAVDENGQVWAWGSGDYGQLGRETTQTETTPLSVVGLPPAQAVSAGVYHSLALARDGTVWAWGYNADGELGNGETSSSATPSKVVGLTNIVSIVAGAYHSLALDSEGKVWAWGFGGSGRLGDGDSATRTAPVQVQGLPAAVSIAAANMSAAIDHDGAVWFWGTNVYGQFGETGVESSLLPRKNTALSALGIAELGFGWYHGVARTVGGKVLTWGGNELGQIGNGTNSVRSTPYQISQIDSAVQVTASGQHTLVIDASATMWGWGANGSGQLGDARVALSNLPQSVPGLSAIAGIAAGGYHAVVRDDGGHLWSWGDNTNGQLGDGTTTMRATPQQLAAPMNVTATAAGREFTLALDSNAEVWSWGRYLNGQLGRIGKSTVPGKIAGLSEVTGISAGAEHALAVDKDGGVWAWGRNTDGNLGDGGTNDSAFPIRVTGVPENVSMVSVAAGEYHSLGLASDGTVWAWGRNSEGQLGDMTTAARFQPTMVFGLANIVGIAAAGGHSLAWSQEGAFWAWGSNEDGQLGTGDAARIATAPVRIENIGRIVHAVAGARHTLAVRDDGLVWAWGRNFEGQLGDGTFAAYNRPVLAVDQSLNGVLDLDSLVDNDISPEKFPPFLAQATRSGDLSRLSLSVDVKGSSGTGALASEVGTFAAAYNVYVAASSPSAGEAVYLQLDADNTWSTLQWPMTEYLRGVALNSQTDVVSAHILRNVDVSGLAGAEVLVGYGTDPDEMLAAARYRKILTVPSQ